MSTISKCGYTGSVNIATEVVSWEFNMQQEAPNATSMDSNGFHEHVPCLKFGDGTFETLVPVGPIGSMAGAQFKNDVETLSGDMILTSVDTTDAVADIIKYKYTFITTGPWS